MDTTHQAIKNFENIKESLKGLYEIMSINISQNDIYFKLASEQNYGPSFIQLGNIYLKGDFVNRSVRKAIYYYKKAIACGEYFGHTKIGNLYRIGKFVKRNHNRAKEHYTDAYSKGRKGHLNNFAWMLSTSRSSAVRDGNLAVKYANEAIKAFGKDSINIDTLAAAYAETGDFGKALCYQKKAIKILIQEGNENQIGDFKTRLDCYLNKKCWRD